MYFRTDPTPQESVAQRKKTKLQALGVLIFTTFLALVLGVLAGVMYYDLHFSGKAVSTYAKFLGIASSLLMLVQWAPQIYTTFKIKVDLSAIVFSYHQSPGSLSVAMLLLQMPGALLIMFFQAILNSADVTTVGSHL